MQVDSLSTDGEHWAGGVADDILGRASQQKPRQAGATFRSNHDHINALTADSIDNDLACAADADEIASVVFGWDQLQCHLIKLLGRRPLLLARIYFDLGGTSDRLMYWIQINGLDYVE